MIPKADFTAAHASRRCRRHPGRANSLRSRTIFVALFALPLLSAPIRTATAAGAVPNLSLATPLDRAAYAGDLAKVRYFLRMGALPNGTDRNGDTPLDFAAQSGHAAVAKLLLSHIDSTNLGDNGNELAHAIINDYLSTVRFLLTHGVALGRVGTILGDEEPAGSSVVRNPSETKFASPIELAIGTGDLRLVKYLIDQGAKPAPDDWETAVNESKDDLARLLLDSGTDATAAMETITGYCPDSPGQRLSQCVSYVEFLIAQGADVNVHINGGDEYSSILGWSVYELTEPAFSHETMLQLAEFLVRHGANVNTEVLSFTGSHTAQKPLLFSLVGRNRYSELVTLLLKHGADVNPVDPSNGETLADELLFNSDAVKPSYLLKAFSSLLTHGLPATGKSAAGTPWVVEAEERHIYPLENMLLDHGADANAVNQKGESLLDILLEGYYETGSTGEVETLLAHGVKVDAPDPTEAGRTALFASLDILPTNRAAAVITLLAKDHADVDQSIKGYTPLCTAISMGRPGGEVAARRATKLSELLIALGANVNQRCRYRHNFSSYYSNGVLYYRDSGHPFGYPLDAAGRYGLPDVVAVLKAHGATG